MWPSIEAVATVVPEGENEMAQSGAAWARKWEITSAVRRSRTTTVPETSGAIGVRLEVWGQGLAASARSSLSNFGAEAESARR